MRITFKVSRAKRYDIINVMNIDVHTEPNVRVEYNPQLRIEPNRLSERINTIIINDIYVRTREDREGKHSINVIEFNMLTDLDMRSLLNPFKHHREDDYFADAATI